MLYAEALQSLESARKTREALAAGAPEMYEPDYAQTLTNLEMLYGARQQFAEARESPEFGSQLSHTAPTHIDSSPPPWLAYSFAFGSLAASSGRTRRHRRLIRRDL